MGSFLGNYHYDPGEQLGDVVLVATTTYGRGRIVVWGDTSAFQGGLSSNYRKVVGPMLAWLSRPAAWTERPAVPHGRRDRDFWPSCSGAGSSAPRRSRSPRFRPACSWGC